jgi:hypothetical protein
MQATVTQPGSTRSDDQGTVREVLDALRAEGRSSLSAPLRRARMAGPMDGGQAS